MPLIMATRIYLCRRCAIDRLHYCPNCRWLNVLAREAEERIELLLRAATVAHVPDEPGPLFWLLAEHQFCAK